MTRRCTSNGCIKAASFAPPPTSTHGRCHALRCAQHQAAGDVDVRSRSKTCAFPACSAQGSYAQTGNRTHGGNCALFCKVHREAGSAFHDRKNRLCQHASCRRRASFGQADGDSAGARWCAAHKGEHDVNLRVQLCSVDACSREVKTLGGVRGVAECCGRGCCVDLVRGLSP